MREATGKIKLIGDIQVHADFEAYGDEYKDKPKWSALDDSFACSALFHLQITHLTPKTGENSATLYQNWCRRPSSVATLNLRQKRHVSNQVTRVALSASDIAHSKPRQRKPNEGSVVNPPCSHHTHARHGTPCSRLRPQTSASREGASVAGMRPLLNCNEKKRAR